MAQIERAEQAQNLLASFQAISALHHQEFPNARQRPRHHRLRSTLPQIEKRHQQATLARVGLFNRSGRAAAKAAAQQAVHQEVETPAAGAREKHAAYQAQLDAWWNKLQTNDPEVVFTTPAEAFEDNDAAAAPGRREWKRRACPQV